MKKNYLLFVLISILLVLQIYTIYSVQEIIAIQGRPTEITILQAPIKHLTGQVTAYTNRVKECNSDNHRTATLEKPIAGWTCAVSQDLIHWLGGRIYIKGIGVRQVNDLMNSRFEQSVDIYMGKVSDAKAFGRQTTEIIYLGK